jgi:hypothetical protein
LLLFQFQLERRALLVLVLLVLLVLMLLVLVLLMLLLLLLVLLVLLLDRQMLYLLRQHRLQHCCVAAAGSCFF